MLSKQVHKGVSFLTEDLEYEKVFTPEEFTEEHKMMADMAEKFIVNQVVPLLGEIENGQLELSIPLLKQAGELGLLGLDVPEEYGGLKLDKISSTLITEKIALGRSFAVTHGGQVGIGSLPIVYFGNREQKEAYLPAVVTGEKIGAYALTEPTSGTDALAAKTTAQLSECSQYYVLNGEKQFITNSAFADFFIVFAQIDREKFTAFIVDRNSEGLSTGPEEKKMGLKGSSTRSLILENVKVPIENILGEIGKGHVIAFNILNIGRHKISATCLGNSKQAIELAVKYAKERKQFGKPLAEFPLIKQKIADMAIKTYVNETMIYRTAHLLDQALEGMKEDGNKMAKAIGTYATECSINKVFSSEALDFIIDEAVQIHGGYGFIAEYEVETLYRDSRVNRIFEGTNEINRILIASNLFRELRDGVEELSPCPSFNKNDLLSKEKAHLCLSKQLLQKGISYIKQQFEDINEEQELLAVVSDTASDIYAMDSVILRTEKACIRNGMAKEQQKIAYTEVYVQETVQKLAIRFNHMLSYLKEERFVEEHSTTINRLLKGSGVDSITEKRKIANNVIEQEKYIV